MKRQSLALHSKIFKDKDQELTKILEPLKWDIVDTLQYVGSPKDDDLKKAEDFGRRFARRLIEIA